jgi:hypothetical protein
MQVNFIELFGLKPNYTREELKIALLQKINIIEKSNMTPIDKKFLLEKYYEQYNIGKNNLETKVKLELKQANLLNPKNHFDFIKKQHSHMLKQFDELGSQLTQIGTEPDSKSKSNVYSRTYSYQSVLNPDGTKTVVESKNLYDNGKSDKKTQSYIIDAQGNKRPISLSEPQKIS